MCGLFGSCHSKELMCKLFKEGKYSDLTIKCKGRVWKVHRAVVCMQSKPLAAAVDGKFKEAFTGEIDLDDDEPEIVALMLDFMYTGVVNIKVADLRPFTGSLFGTPLSGNTINSSTRLFGETPTATASSTPAYPSAGGLFGGTQTQAVSTGSTTTANPTIGGSTGMFQLNANPSNAAPSLFGSSAPTANRPTSSLFANISAAPTANPTPRAPTQQRAGSAYGFPQTFPAPSATPAATAATSSSTNTTSRSTSSGFSFGSTLTQNTASVPPATARAPRASDTDPQAISPYALELPRLAKLYVLGERYDVQPLKEATKKKYQDLIQTSSCTSYFVESLKIIYEGTPDTTPPDPLWSYAITVAGENAKSLMDRGEFVALCKENGDFATDILKASLGFHR